MGREYATQLRFCGADRVESETFPELAITTQAIFDGGDT